MAKPVYRWLGRRTPIPNSPRRLRPLGLLVTYTATRRLYGDSFSAHLHLAWSILTYIVCDPTIRQPGFDLPRQQWSLLNRFSTEQGHCGACRRKWRLTDTDLCPCGETQSPQTMFHIVESCPEWRLICG